MEVALDPGTSGWLNAVAWSAFLPSKSVSVRQSEFSLPHFLTHSCLGLVHFVELYIWGRKGGKRGSCHPIVRSSSQSKPESFPRCLHFISVSLGIWVSGWYFMVNIFNLLGVLHLQWFVTLFWSTILQSEKVYLEKSKTLLLSGTYCIVWVVVTRAITSHGILSLYPAEWGENLERLKKIIHSNLILMINVKPFLDKIVQSSLCSVFYQKRLLPGE